MVVVNIFARRVGDAAHGTQDQGYGACGRDVDVGGSGRIENTENGVNGARESGGRLMGSEKGCRCGMIEISAFEKKSWFREGWLI